MKALFVVEPNFINEHVGVRRVILHYMEALEQSGCAVDLAAPRDGQVQRLGFAPTPAGDVVLAWTDKRARRGDYESVVVTNPWLCANGLPDLPGCVGLVYDMIPNLIATGCLRFSNASGIYRFAHDHDVGYRYYLRNARKISCISESTRNDFLSLYGPSRADLEVTSHIPFTVSQATASDTRGARVLLVNALDARKNLSGIADVLLLAHAVTPVQVDVVGQARIANRAVADFFTRLTNAGIAAHWHREATDATLNALYRTASVLLFPSLYEGLGLPVLEAQQAGMPAITTDTASLPEINLNPSLCFASEDIAGMAQALSDVVAERCTVLRGEPLRAALAKRFSVQVSSSEALAA